MGKKRIVLSLKTPDLATAQARRFDANAVFNREVEQARRKLGPDAVVEQGLEWRERMDKLNRGDAETIASFWGHSGMPAANDRGEPPTAQAVALMNADLALSDHVDHLRDTMGEGAGALLFDVAMGRATPLLHYLDAWLREGGRGGPYLPTSARGFRSDLAEIANWAGQAGMPKTLEGFTRQACGRWVQERLALPGANRKTINRKISAASAYWEWLVKRGHAAANPWARQSLPKVTNAREDSGKRAFTDDEVRRLLAGAADQELDDAMRLAALTGARIDALYQLRVRDCRDGWFVIPPQKKEPAARRVPIHQDLSGIVKRRCEGKAAADFLLHEPGTTARLSARSGAASKRFGHYRKRPGVDVDEKRPGVRQSDITFHSWRRWFITQAEQAGQPPHVVSAVVGHVEGRKGMTLGTYSGGPSDDQLRAVVESVHLPTSHNAPRRP